MTKHYRHDPRFIGHDRDFQQTFRGWIKSRQQHYTHFITLASNNPMLRLDAANRLLREWDARMNREIVGPKWTKRPDERCCWIACLEGQASSLHWHILFRPAWDLPENQVKRFDDKYPFGMEGLVADTWHDICKSGSTKTLLIESDGAIRYTTKLMHRIENTLAFQDSFFFIR